MTHILAKVTANILAESKSRKCTGSAEVEASSRNCDEKCNQAVKAVGQETDCRQVMAGGSNKRVYFGGDLGEGDDDYELEEAYEVYEVYDYITCVISKMVGGLRRKRKSCNGKERLGTPRPQASGGVRFACQEN